MQLVLVLRKLTYLLLLFHLPPLSFFVPGVISQQENGKTVSVSNTIRIPVERKDNGAALSCEASHPALVGQKRVRHYSLDVHCEPTMPSCFHDYCHIRLISCCY